MIWALLGHYPRKKPGAMIITTSYEDDGANERMMRNWLQKTTRGGIGIPAPKRRRWMFWKRKEQKPNEAFKEVARCYSYKSKD